MTIYIFSFNNQANFQINYAIYFFKRLQYLDQRFKVYIYI